ncbi:hypothetical protein [Flagellimonas taeanensis]|uniref:hypothetical protein n=1 Tax=Flagellimonas taeanensis TaxID=1005926 RepID=UPI001C725CAA|nr:hypothetical protein [Allomuricauda taeanensis]
MNLILLKGVRFTFTKLPPPNKLLNTKNMGSTGTGRFTDYSGEKPESGDGKTGGSSEENRCEKAFSAMLEEIERCTYFTENEDVPKVGEIVTISFDNRPVAISERGLVIGYLPTKFNYIKMCMDDRYSYSGRVVSSSNELVAAVTVDVQPDNKE